MNQKLKKLGRRLAAFLKKNQQRLVDGLVLTAILLFSSWLMMSTLGYVDGKMYISSKLWSDFGAHIPLIRSFSHGDNLPPEYPIFPGEPIRYHYLFYLIAGILEKIGLNLAFAVNIPSILGFSLLLWMIYRYTVLFFRSRDAGVIAVLLFLFNGSLTFLKYFEKNPLSPGSGQQIYELMHFVSFGPWDGGKVSAFMNLNIYTNQRHLAASFGLLLLLIWPLIKSSFERSYPLTKKRILGIWISMSLFPLLHQAGSMVLALFLVSWLGTLFVKNSILKKGKFSAEMAIVYGIGTVMLALSFFGSYGFESKQVEFQPGYLSNSVSLWVIAEYWLHNLGLYLLLYPIVLFWLSFGFVKNKKWWKIPKIQILKKNFPILLFLTILTFFFVIANLFRLSPDMINNHKFINVFMIGMNIVVAGFLVDRWKKKRYLKWCVPAIFFVLTLSGVIDFFPIKNDGKMVIHDALHSDIIKWIDTNTERNSTFLTSTYLYNPASLAGRKIFLDHGYFAWSLGYQDQLRRRKLPLMFSSTLRLEEWCSLMDVNDLDYVLLSPGRGELDEKIFIEESFLVRELSPEFVSEENYRLYKVARYCQS